MENEKSEAREIIDALERGEYKVSYEAPNCFEEHTKKDGSVFYIIRDDDAQFGCDFGVTTVTVTLPCGASYDFTWNVTEQEWEGLDDISYGDSGDDDEEEGDDDGSEDDFREDEDSLREELVDSLSNSSAEILSDCPDTDELISFYELATGESVEAYHYEDQNIPEYDGDDEDDEEEEEE